MKLHDLAPNPGAKHRKKRVGRGISAGQGKTAGRGTKGEGARNADGGSLYRQGGNLPFYRSLPFKRGFINTFRTEYVEVSLSKLTAFAAGEEVSVMSLAQKGIIRDETLPVVILGNGDISQALTVKVQRVTASAKAKIEAAGGSVEIVA